MNQACFALWALQHPEARRSIMSHCALLKKAYADEVDQIKRVAPIKPPAILEDTLAEYLLETVPVQPTAISQD